MIKNMYFPTIDPSPPSRAHITHTFNHGKDQYILSNNVEPNVVVLYNLQSKPLLHYPHDSKVISVTSYLQHGNNQLLTATEDGEIYHWCALTGERTGIINNPTPLLCLKCFHDGRDFYLVGGNGHGYLTYINLTTGRISNIKKVHHSAIRYLTTVSDADSNLQLISAADDNCVVFHDPYNMKITDSYRYAVQEMKLNFHYTYKAANGIPHIIYSHTHDATKEELLIRRLDTDHIVHSLCSKTEIVTCCMTYQTDDDTATILIIGTNNGIIRFHHLANQNKFILKAAGYPIIAFFQVLNEGKSYIYAKNTIGKFIPLERDYYTARLLS